jgi:Tol biopolymer transport system component
LAIDRRWLAGGAAVILAALVAVIGVAAIDHWREQPPPLPPAIRLALSPPPGAEPGSGDEPLDAAISPDQSEIVFAATTNGVTQLWRRAFSDERAELVPGTEGARFPAWKQTGRVISFFAAGRLKAVAGGVTDLTAAPASAGATWLRDGSLLFGTASGPIKRLRDGRVTDATTLAAGDIAHTFPFAVGTTDDFVYTAARVDGRRVARLVSNGQARDLSATSGHAVLVDDHLLHVRDGVLLAYPRNPETGILSGRGVPIGFNVGVSPQGRALFSASPRLVLHAPAATRARQLVWLNASGTRESAVGDTGDYWQVRLSPDDAQVAVTAMAPLLRTLDVVVMPTAGAGDAQRLTSAIAADTDPVWSPDGSRVMFRSMQDGQPNLFARTVRVKDGRDELILRSDLDETPTDWNGRQVLFHARDADGVDVYLLDIRTGARGRVANTGFNETDARWSADGRWAAFVSDESGRPDIYARRADGMRVQVSFGGGMRPRWSRNGAAIFFVRGSQMMRADLAGDRFSAPRALFDVPGIVDFDVAHRSDRFLVVLPVAGSVRPTVSSIVDWRSLIGAP